MTIKKKILLKRVLTFVFFVFFFTNIFLFLLALILTDTDPGQTVDWRGERKAFVKLFRDKLNNTNNYIDRDTMRGIGVCTPPEPEKKNIAIKC